MMELEHHHLMAMPVFRHLLVNVSEIYYILLFYYSISLIHMNVQCKSLTHFTQEILLKMLEPTEPFFGHYYARKNQTNPKHCLRTCTNLQALLLFFDAINVCF